MANISINNKVLEKYMGILSRLDNVAKKVLIKRLTKSLDSVAVTPDVHTLFGAWEDSRNSEQIINDIRKSRFEKGDSETFE